jgi:hypothetical protein
MPTTARQLLDLVAQFQTLRTLADQTPDELVRKLDDKQLRLAVQVIATTFKELKTEAVRRGLWEDFKTIKP